MNSSLQAVPEAPLGVDPAVLAKINAMFARTTQRTPIADQVVEAGPKGLKEETALMPVDEGAWFESSCKKKKKKKPVRKGMMGLNNEDSDEGERSSPQKAPYKVQEAADEIDDAKAHDVPETHPLLPKDEQDDNADDDPADSSADTPSSQPTDPAAPRILTRIIYPYERKTPNTPSPVPPRRSLPKTTPKGPIDPPSLSTLLLGILAYLRNLIFDSSPNIIEYSPYQIRETYKKIVVRVEAQEVEFPSPPSSTSTSAPPNSSSSSSDTGIMAPGSVVGVIALLHVDDGRNVQQNRIIEVRAKPKRVRQLLQDEGVEDLVEDMYGMEIMGALRKLERKMSRKKGV
jgi:hypothetical protein